VSKMPDGDVVYHKVGGGYTDVYHALCQEHYSAEQVANMLAAALQRGLKRYGYQSINLLMTTFEDVSSALAKGTGLDATQESFIIDDVARGLMGHRRGIPLAIDACKDYVLSLAEGTISQPNAYEMVRNYVKRVLAADFYERLPLTHHYDNADPVRVERRLEQVRQYLDGNITSIVAHIVNKRRVDRFPKVRVDTPDFANTNIPLP
jgi:hypothetical protein